MATLPVVESTCMEEESRRERRRATLLRQISDALKVEGSAKFNKDFFRRVFHSKDLGQKLFELFDEKQEGQLAQDEWLESLKERLTDEKQADFAEQLESVAYVLCGDEPINPERFRAILQAKGVLDKLFRLVDKEADGVVTPAQIMDFLAQVSASRPKSGFDQGSLEWLETLFRQTVGDKKEISLDDFNKIVNSKNPFFRERVFQIFDKDDSGSISRQEFFDAMQKFAGQSPEDKIRFLFKVYDIDGDGLVQRRELEDVMRACMEENGMSFSEEQLQQLTGAMFDDADVAGRGAITYDALKAQLERHGGLLENLSISIDRWLVPPKPIPPPKKKKMLPYQFSMPYMRNNLVYLAFLSIYAAINAGLFLSRIINYYPHGYYLMFARASGQCLNFNCMFVLVLMLRHCITFLRTRGFAAILPLDQNIYLHKLVGMMIFAMGILHSIMHILNVVFAPDLGNLTPVQWLFTSKPGILGLIPGWADPTGVILIIVLSIMVICSQPFVRRGGSFEIFYWTHLLYVPFFFLLILHAPNFWKWFLAPGLIFLAEQVVRFTWLRTERGKTYISSGLLLPSKVVHLVIKRPLHFDFHVGDYVFVNVPAIAKYEWHPFTISSAPEQEGYIWLHVRGVGEWTNRLYAYFEREQERLHATEAPAASTILPGLTTPTTGNGAGGVANPSFVGDSNLTLAESISPISTESSIVNVDGSSPGMKSTPGGPMATPGKLPLLLLSRKQPLNKSLSMPDVNTKMKNRQRLLALREYARSESEKSFDECEMRRARLKALGLAYLSPQNKSLAQSFRYMRNKPTIIAFKTPSLEHCEAQRQAAALDRKSPATTMTSPGSDLTAVEEGRADFNIAGLPGPNVQINYPVGKPVEIQKRFSLSNLDDSLGITKYPPLEKPIKIYLDGPYGAPSAHIFRAQHAVLIATGIGVTPFASILQSIMHRYWKARHSCPKCQFSWASEIPPTVMHLRKVDFFWINRDQRSFEWFVNLLSQLEMEQAELGAAMERFLEMHMYITSALQRTDMKAVGLQLALDLLHQKEKRDLITGLKTRTNAGRPNWDKVFAQIQAQRKGKVTVFFCGPPQLARIIRVKCGQFGFNFRKEVF